MYQDIVSLDSVTARGIAYHGHFHVGTIIATHTHTHSIPFSATRPKPT